LSPYFILKNDGHWFNFVQVPSEREWLAIADCDEVIALGIAEEQNAIDGHSQPLGTLDEIKPMAKMTNPNAYFDRLLEEILGEKIFSKCFLF